MEDKSGTRYANLIYLLDKHRNLAMIFNTHYDRWIPAGTRLKPFEMPHLAVHRAISEELGLSQDMYAFWPKRKYPKYEETEIAPRPYQVQIEEGPHKEGENGEVIYRHYDFVYVCITEDSKPSLSSKYNARWIALKELREEISNSPDKAITFKDVEITYEKLLEEVEQT